VRITVIHQYFLRPGESGGSRFNEMTRFWKEAGHEVTVIAGQVHYATGVRAPEYRGRWIVEEDAGGVRVLRCYTPGTYHKGTAGRILAFLGFLLSSVWAVLFRVGRPDVVVATSPPLITAVPGIAAKRLLRVPLVFEVRDLWPESAVTTGVLRERGWFTRMLFRLEAAAYREADRINVLTPAFRENILARGLADPGKIVFIPNGADLDTFSPGPRDNGVRRDRGWGNRFVALYAGAHGKANHLGQLIDAAERLLGEDVLLVTVGDGPERQSLAEEARRRDLDNIQFLGPVPKERMADFVRAADVGLAVLKKVDTFKTVYPNKVFDYMACERPVLVAIDGVARDLVEKEAAAGLFAEPEDAGAIAAQILRLKSNPDLCARMGTNGGAFVRQHFSREALAARYEEILSDVAKRERMMSTKVASRP
jgi:glycosyltransferase involved in cell wall biosynthesis